MRESCTDPRYCTDYEGLDEDDKAAEKDEVLGGGDDEERRYEGSRDTSPATTASVSKWLVLKTRPPLRLSTILYDILGNKWQ